MIPKIIHYCWFGGNPLPKLTKKCIKSWKKYCKDYKIIKWDESNFDIEACPLYVRQAYQEKKWAFVTDYVRLKIIYENGGIYLDTDVELIKSLDNLCKNKAFFALEKGDESISGGKTVYIATGLGFGAEKKSDIIKEMMADYEDIPFILSDGSYDQTTCPSRNTKVLFNYGFIPENKLQLLDKDIKILPSEYMCPYTPWSLKGEITEDTISIHWYAGTWLSEEVKKRKEKYQKREKWNKIKDFIKYLPNRILLRILGKEKYERIKSLIKR